jgi:hypothetical protein
VQGVPASAAWLWPGLLPLPTCCCSSSRLSRRLPIICYIRCSRSWRVRYCKGEPARAGLRAVVAVGI